MLPSRVLGTTQESSAFVVLLALLPFPFFMLELSARLRPRWSLPSC
jgi:hypothetical protein